MIYFILLLELYIVLHLSLVVYLAQKKLNEEIKLANFYTTKTKK
ncbi:hypothetical protein SAMN04487992_11826 [Cellulophaga baltica]|uniref:Uncharacterized protein n=1 Tax=Cellulophaga baltica TaxID=76594 RepID=A0A1G7LI58_9FLAO|nr:hypothetical protein SAMN04487992_11826 [Cellulophaga baltica]